MEYIMTIGDTMIIPNIGFVIVGGNPQINKNDTSKLCNIGDDITIKSGDEELVFKVLDVKLSFSISEKIIISMMLEESKDFCKLNPGNKVYKNWYTD